ncbi:MAG: polyphosphate kinase 1 [Eubacterium sp.]|nr:polyphosphate kinase 1 [Eubacterium sp.]
MTENSVYDNRELSWLKFNRRVLEEAEDRTVPLFERLRFISIFSSNLDEFFMVRVGTLRDTLLLTPNKKDNKTAMTPEKMLDAICDRVRETLPAKDAAYDDIIERLAVRGAHLLKPSELHGEDKAFMKHHFEREIMPLLSPGVIDKNHPFPFLKNRSVYIGVMLRKSDEKKKLGIISAETGKDFPRVIFLPGDEIRFLLVEDVILHYADKLFGSYSLDGRCLFRVTRNADISAEEALFDHDMDFRHVMEELVRKRKKLMPVRAEFSAGAPQEIVNRLLEYFELDKKYAFTQRCPLDFEFISLLGKKLEKSTELFFTALSPQQSAMVNPYESMFTQLSQRDILLSYPYEKFKSFLRLLNEAADDPYVSSIKITLYRVARDSEIVSALIRAAESGKSVLALVELRARFDEENNIDWSKKMEEAGVKIIYGLDHLKVHSKLLLITRKTGNGIKYFTQIGTGNYNENTAKLYTDLTLMTSDKDIGADASLVFNALALGNTVESSNVLLVAPRCLKSRIVEMIDIEIAFGSEGYIGLKLNSLTDRDLIDKLIAASCKGVKIDLIIRGICCLVAGIEGKTENITVTSVVGRFLEHSRIYIFGKGERRKTYISSADFMTRNTERRVEVAAPLKDPAVADRVYGIFNDMLKDNVKARVQCSDGIYRRKHRAPDEPEFEAHKEFYLRAYQAAEQAEKQYKPPKKSLFRRIKEYFAK